MFRAVEEFERRVAKYANAPYAVAVDSCTSAILLSCAWVRACHIIDHPVFEIPKYTYCSVPNAIINAGGIVKFDSRLWNGTYQIRPYSIIDGALRFTSNMYLGDLHCLSFGYKKHLPIGRGGMILCPSKESRDWLRLARWNGRCAETMEIKQLGWNCYMLPEWASRGLYLMYYINKVNEDKIETYPDLEALGLYT